MENGTVVLVLLQQKTFVGKLMAGNSPNEKVLTDSVEVMPIINTQTGSPMMVGMLVGTITLPSDAVVAILSKESMYYRNYIQTTSNIRVV